MTCSNTNTKSIIRQGTGSYALIINATLTSDVDQLKTTNSNIKAALIEDSHERKQNTTR